MTRTLHTYISCKNPQRMLEFVGYDQMYPSSRLLGFIRYLKPIRSRTVGLHQFKRKISYPRVMNCFVDPWNIPGGSLIRPDVQHDLIWPYLEPSCVTYVAIHLCCCGENSQGIITKQPIYTIIFSRSTFFKGSLGPFIRISHNASCKPGTPHNT